MCLSEVNTGDGRSWSSLRILTLQISCVGVQVPPLQHIRSSIYPSLCIDQHYRGCWSTNLWDTLLWDGVSIITFSRSILAPVTVDLQPLHIFPLAILSWRLQVTPCTAGVSVAPSYKSPVLRRLDISSSFGDGITNSLATLNSIASKLPLQDTPQSSRFADVHHVHVC